MRTKIQLTRNVRKSALARTQFNTGKKESK